MRTAPQMAYMIWIAVSTVGLVQALASYYGWAGLSFFRRRPQLGYVCAAVCIPVSYFWFFSLTNRNVPGLEGYQLFSRFALGVAGGLVVVLALSSWINADMVSAPSRPRGQREQGLDALRSDTYAHLIAAATRNSGLLRLVRAARHRSWPRVLSLLGRLAATPQGPARSAQPAQRSGSEGEH